MSSLENTPKAGAAAPQEQLEQPSLLDQILKAGRFTKAPERGVSLVDAFVQQALEGSVALGRDVEGSINAKLTEIDQLLSQQMDEILHDAAYQKLEASWRGLRHLLDQSETGPLLKIKVLNISKRELLKDYQKASEFDQSRSEERRV